MASAPETVNGKVIRCDLSAHTLTVVYMTKFFGGDHRIEHAIFFNPETQFDSVVRVVKGQHEGYYAAENSNPPAPIEQMQGLLVQITIDHETPTGSEIIGLELVTA